MTKISIAADLPRALKGASSLVVMVPEGLGEGAKFPAALPAGLGDRCRQLLRMTQPGAQGAISWSLTDLESPAALGVAVVPGRASRHNHPARPDLVSALLGPLGARRDKKLAIAAVLPTADHELPLANAAYRAFPRLSYQTRSEDTPDVHLVFLDRNGAHLGIDKWAHSVAEHAQQAAEWVDTPPSNLHPSEMAKRAKARLRPLKSVRVTEIVGDKLLDAGLGGIHGVGKAAAVPPRLLVAQYGSPRAERHVALVGKGITFDTGGLHLKARGAMEGMKADMGGAAAVLGAFEVLASHQVPVRISLLLALAENAIGPGAFKPDDILTLHSGKTVEINNTDAEGRLLLGDAVSWAARKLECDTILDAATLTGAQLIATGLMHAAVVSNDQDLENRLVRAGMESGDLCHPLPFAPELYQKEFESPIADMRNSVKNRMNAQSSCAAQFVYSHLEGVDVRWGHVDLAGPAFRSDRGTGFGVGLLAQTVAHLGSPSRRPRPRRSPAST
ncbi:MAG: M17 family metallopeptidase [Myxococcota bacterium]